MTTTLHRGPRSLTLPGADGHDASLSAALHRWLDDGGEPAAAVEADGHDAS